MAWKLKTGINTLKANPPWPPFPEQRGLDKTKGESPLAPLSGAKGVRQDKGRIPPGPPFTPQGGTKKRKKGVRTAARVAGLVFGLARWFG